MALNTGISKSRPPSFRILHIRHGSLSTQYFESPLLDTPLKIPFREFIPLTNSRLTCVTYLCVCEHGAVSDAFVPNNQGSNTNRARLPRDVMYPHDRESMPCRGLPHLHLHACCQNIIISALCCLARRNCMWSNEACRLL
jgi:hypothetical protein